MVLKLGVNHPGCFTVTHTLCPASGHEADADMAEDGDASTRSRTDVSRRTSPQEISKAHPLNAGSPIAIGGSACQRIRRCTTGCCRPS